MQIKHRLWSVEELTDKFRVASFATVIGQLRESATIIQLVGDNASVLNTAGVQDAAKHLIGVAIKEADEQFKELRLSEVLRQQWNRLLKRSNEGAPHSEMVILLQELNNNLMVELSSSCFLRIPSDHRFVYEQPSPIFGPEAHNAFPDARRDIAAAGRCCALGEWTACVIHLMRALEFALRWLAGRVKLDAKDYEAENWKNVIDRIEKKIREMEALPKSLDKKENLQFLSEAATQFRWFKDAWRNEASHGHAHYDEHDGPLIFLHVSDFFRHIGKGAVKGVADGQQG